MKKRSNLHHLLISLVIAITINLPTMAVASVDNRNTPCPMAFADYPAEPPASARQYSTKVTPATPQARRYRTVISQDGVKPPNFSGHYRIVTWGCGTDCHGFAIVNRKTGVAITPKGIDYVAGAMGNDQPRIDFRLDSRLLVLNGLINDEDEGSFFYEWTGRSLKLLRRQPLKRENLADDSSDALSHASTRP